MSDRWYIEEEGGRREPVMLDPDGRVIVPVDPSYIADNGKRFRKKVRREPPIIAAAPGWYAAVSWWHLDELASDESEVQFQIERHPIVAWDVDPVFGDAYLIGDYEDGPIQRLGDLNRSDLAPIGIFHEQYKPEPATIEESARLAAQDAAKDELARMRRREAAQVNGSGALS